MINFDKTPDRKESWSYKWQKYKGQDILPCWIADTEFRCADGIVSALSERVDHGVMGYTLPSLYEPANNAVKRWLKDKHDWAIEDDWIVWTPGVVPAFNVVCKAYCQPGDKVMVQTPNYPPLLAAPAIHGLERVDIDTVNDNGRWTIDFTALETHAADPAVKLFIVCNPMNPVGSVLTADEMQLISDICNKHNVLLCSDEIHCDLIVEPGVKHIPAGREANLADNSITLMAASKTFNVAGLGTSFAIIPDRKLRTEFVRAAAGIVPWVTVLGLVATEAAFTVCDNWYNAQINYLRQNRDELVARVNKIEGLSVISPEATFLAWIDGSNLGVENVQKWCEGKGIGPSPGADFAAPEFFRINYGCSRSMLNSVLERIEK